MAPSGVGARMSEGGLVRHHGAPLQPGSVNGLDDVIELETGLGYGCVRNQAGETWCWGRNQYGNLGDGSTTDRAEPVRVRTDVVFVDVAAGQLRRLWGDRSANRLVLGA